MVVEPVNSTREDFLKAKGKTLRKNPAAATTESAVICIHHRLQARLYGATTYVNDA